MDIYFSYQSYAILEVMAERGNKKFYVEEILEELRNCNNIIDDSRFKDVTDLEVHMDILLGDLKGFSDYIDTDNIIIKCAKYKKAAFKIGDYGITLIRKYKSLRDAFIDGFRMGCLMSHMNNEEAKLPEGTDSQEDVIKEKAKNAWFAYVFKKEMEFGSYIAERERQRAILRNEEPEEDEE